jgi:hypothetical protein
MTIGRRADSDDTLERAAKILAVAFGCGSSWTSSVVYGKSLGLDGDFENHRSLTVAEREGRRGRAKYIEKPTRDQNGVLTMHGVRSWRTHAFVATPSFVPGYDALGALAMAKLEGPLEAILLLYATGDVERFWPVVEGFGLACVRNAFASEALTDAIQRILCGRAAISMDDRAKQLGVRASGYRGLTRSVETRLRRWLITAASRYLACLG